MVRVLFNELELGKKQNTVFLVEAFFRFGWSSILSGS
jgi:hypothetical protein